MKLTIVTDSAADLSYEYFELNSDLLKLVPTPVMLDGIDITNQNLPLEDFYSELKSGKVSSTSQINEYTFYEEYTNLVNNGSEVLSLTLSSGLSSAYQNSDIAAAKTNIEAGETKVYAPDTLSASVGLTVLVDHSIYLARSGFSTAEINQWILENRLKIAHYFCVDELSFLKRGGRISTTNAVLGAALQVKPILSMNKEGKLYNHSTERGKKKAIARLVLKCTEEYDKQARSVIVIGHAACLGDAVYIKDQLSSVLPEAKIIITEIGMTIGSHVGPGMVAVAFISTNEREV